MGLISWIKSFFNKVGTLIKKAWNLAKPFLKEVLSKTAQNIWASSQDILIAAVQHVAEQGLPTEEAKQEAFKIYLKEKLSTEFSELKTSELNLLREMAVTIYKKATS